MDTILKSMLITVWLFALIYFSIPKNEDLITQSRINEIDSNKAIDDKIKKYSTFLFFNALLVIIYGGSNQVFNHNTHDQLTGTLLMLAGSVLGLAAYGIRNKYSWGRAMTPLLLIIITILIISTTHLSDNFDNFLVGSNSNHYINLLPFFNPITVTDLITYFTKIGYFAVLSVISVRFLEKPDIKANLSR